MKHLFLALALPAMVLLTSCSGSESEGGDSAPKPTLSFQTGPGFTSANTKTGVDSVLNIGIIAKSNDSKLSKINISLSTNGGTAGIIFDTTINTNSTAFTYKYKVMGTVGDVLKLTVKAMDANGTTSEQSINVEIVPPLSFISGPSNQFIYNLQGPSEGAYDLRTGLNKKLGDNPDTKDIIDGTPTSAVFSKSWVSGNGSKFVKISANEWTLTNTASRLYDLWKANASNAKSTVTDIKKGDVILVKSGQPLLPYGLYIINIMDVKETLAPGDNSDYIKFEYKGDTI